MCGGDYNSSRLLNLLSMSCHSIDFANAVADLSVIKL